LNLQQEIIILIDMAKKNIKEQKKHTQKLSINLDYAFEPAKNLRLLIFLIIGIASFGLAFFYLNSALKVNGSFGFPLDDPWIHLTFAKNLSVFHSFSYFKNEMATAGSTSPIYTLLLAVGFLITNNEMVLSYFFGILFLILSAVSFYKLSSFEFAKENVYAIIFTAILVADKWLNFVADSGMETTMFIFVLIACSYFYKKRDTVPFAIFLGLIFWSRPDGIAFIGALAVDYIASIYFSKKDTNVRLFSKNDLRKIAFISGAILVVYFGMNLMLSGSLLPNTYNAKLTYYSPEFKSRGDFFKFEVWEYFTRGAYGVIIAGFFFSIAKVLYDFYKKQYNQNILYIVFIFALVFIYWLKLPYAHRFGRYLMPIIPFMILSSGLGFRDAAKLLGGYFKSRNFAVGLFVIVSAIILFISVQNYLDNKSNYATECKYISDRQVAAAKWIRDNTNENDIIATHDVGAIGFYSNRKIVDVAGLITPELIDKINERDYSTIMTDYLKSHNVTYLAFLREWYRVVNQVPLFTTIDISPIETMEIYKFFPDKTHIMNKDANSMDLYAQNLLGGKSPQQAVQILNRSLTLDPRSSYTYYVLANANLMMNDRVGFEKNISKAIELFPEYKEALFLYGNFYKSINRPVDAGKYYAKCLEITPDDKKIKDLMNSLNINDTTKTK
jgi:tetratricopeptide (TPR) repeat protein